MKTTTSDLIDAYAARFLAKTVRGPFCWTFTGSVNGSGYGTFLVGSRSDGTRRNMMAHRFAYELSSGPIADNSLVVHHRCFNRLCVNPAHLELTTQSENLKAHPAGFVPAKSRVTHCPRSHPYDEVNTYLKALPNGKSARCCRECGREANRMYYARKQEVAFL